jgi:hypothetical protein
VEVVEEDMVDDNRGFCAGIYLCRGSLGMDSSQRDSERAAEEQDDNTKIWMFD